MSNINTVHPAAQIKAFREDFNDYLEDEGLEPVEVRIGYSGRTMYGRSCVAIVTDQPFAVMMRLGMFLAGRDQRDTLVRSFDRCAVRSDSMGHRGTVLYWPSIEVTP